MCEMIIETNASGKNSSNKTCSESSRAPSNSLRKAQHAMVMIPMNGKNSPSAEENGPTVFPFSDLLFRIVRAGDHKHTTDAASKVIPMVENE